MSEIAELFEPQSESVEETVETTESEVEVVDEVKQEESEPEVESKPEPEEEPTSSEKDSEKQDWTLAAVKDERSKRQAIEKEFAEYRAKHESKESKAEMPDIFEDQEAYTKALTEKHQQDMHNLRIEMYREAMIEANPDYEEKEVKFLEMAKENPILATELRKAKNPAKFVYEQVKKHEKFQEMQDVEAYEKKLRAEYEAKFAKEAQAKRQESSLQEQTLSPSLAKARGSASEKPEDLPENPADLF